MTTQRFGDMQVEARQSLHIAEVSEIFLVTVKRWYQQATRRERENSSQPILERPCWLSGTFNPAPRRNIIARFATDPNLIYRSALQCPQIPYIASRSSPRSNLTCHLVPQTRLIISWKRSPQSLRQGVQVPTSGDPSRVPLAHPGSYCSMHHICMGCHKEMCPEQALRSVLLESEKA